MWERSIAGTGILRMVQHFSGALNGSNRRKTQKGGDPDASSGASRAAQSHFARQGGLPIAYTFDIRPHRRQLLFDLFIAAIDVINAVDLGFAFCGQRRKNQCG